MSHIATLAQISDLHFIEELTERGRRQWLKQLGTKSHDFQKVAALGEKFDEFATAGRHIDLTIATGDITTDGAPNSFRTALSFIEGDDVPTGNSDTVKGLRAVAGKRIVIPGNHDRYSGNWLPLQGRLKEFEVAFKPPQAYPHTVGYRPPHFDQDDRRAPALLFFIFDSTLTRSSRVNSWKRIARGSIEDWDLNWLRQRPAVVRANRKVRGLNNASVPLDYDAAIRIAVLHHHPVYDPNATPTLASRLGAYTTLMEDNQGFVEACFDAGVDIVLFGHQHSKYHVPGRAGARVDAHDIDFFCCASTSEYSLRDNSFDVIDFGTDQFTIQNFKWNATDDYDGDSFVEEKPLPYSYKRDMPWRG